MRKRIIPLIALFLIALLIFSGCQESDKSKYDKAQSLMAKGQFAEAGAQFAELGSYEESAKLAMYCKAAAAGENEDYETALSTFSLLGDYKESQFMITYYRARKTESDAAKEADYYHYLDAAEAYDEIALFRDSRDRANACREKVYNAAVQLAEEDLFYSSTDLLFALGDYNDSQQLCKYYKAFCLETEENFLAASTLFSELGDYKDASDQAKLVFIRRDEAVAALEAEGDAHLEKGEWEKALQDYSTAIAKYAEEYEGYAQGFGGLVYIRAKVDSLGVIMSLTIDASSETPGLGQRVMEPEYIDHFIGKTIPLSFDPEIDAMTMATRTSEAVVTAINRIEIKSPDSSSETNHLIEKISNTYYQKGTALRNEKKWDEAIIAFKSAGNFSNAEEQILATYYAEAVSKRGLMDWDGAVDAFTFASGYQDADEQAFITQYAEAEWLLGENKKEEAASVFMSIEGYKDSSDRAKQIYFSAGDEYLANQEWDLAIGEYAKYGHKRIGTASAQGFLSEIQVTVTLNAAGIITSMTVDASDETPSLGGVVMQEKFINQFIGKKLPLVYGEGVDTLVGATQTSDAVLLALNSIADKSSMADFDDSVIEKINEVYYLQAKALESEGNYQAAFEIFSTLSGYKDVDSILETGTYSVLKRTKVYSVSKEALISTITVTIKALDGVISECTIESDDENDFLTDEMKQEWAELILNNGTAEVDAITSSTLWFSVHAVQDAVNEILEEMKKDSGT